MQLFSTKYSDDKIDKFGNGVLTAEIKDATSITIVSAYYSIDFLENILYKVLKKNRSKCNLLLRKVCTTRAETRVDACLITS